MGSQPSSKSRDSKGGGGAWDDIREPPKPSLWDHFEEAPGEEPMEQALLEELDPTPPPPDAETDQETSGESQPRRRYKMRSIDDVINSSERIFNDFQNKRARKDELEAFAKIANVIVSAKKAQAQIGGEKPEAIDLTKIVSNPDLETMRPRFVEAANFGDMTEDERRHLFERAKPGAASSGNGGGNGDGE